MKKNIAVVGLGYVGLPVAVEFGKKQRVIGFDINEKRIELLNKNIDITNEVSEEDLKLANMKFTSNAEELRNANFIIIAVPTPITESKKPDLTALKSASQLVGSNMDKGTIIVYESTVYPGATEEECIPILEEYSGLKSGVDFFVGYSPERINPGDKIHTFSNITKVVSGQTDEVCEEIAEVYETVVNAGVFKAASIKVAEAAKVIENTQRDINIALMNELSLIFDKMDIDTTDVINAASTKWNFLKFSPGLVGGHCIGVDPYYLTYKADKVGHHPKMILAGREINDNTGSFIATTLIKDMIKSGIEMHKAIVTIYGFTFKENVPDIRNTRVIDIVKELESFGVTVQVTDAEADSNEVKKHYGIDIKSENELSKSDAIILAVGHNSYVQNGWSLFQNVLKEKAVVFDVKSILNKNQKPEGIVLRRL